MAKKISELPAATLPAVTDQVEVNQGGVSKRLSLAQVRGRADFEVKDYGAICNGVADDKAAIQAALIAADNSGFNGATVRMPPGNLRITGALEFPDPAGAGYYAGISFFGDSPHTTTILYDGPVSDVTPTYALKVMGQTGYQAGRFTLRNIVAGSRGQSIGILHSSDNPLGGTLTGQCTWYDIHIDNFFHGMQIGESGPQKAGSELLFIRPFFQNCDVGMGCYDYNTITIIIMLLGISGCGIGVKDGGSASNIHVYGGSASFATTAAFHFTTDSAHSIHGFYTESSYFLTCHSSRVHVDSCHLQATGERDDFLMDVRGGTVSITDTMFGGKIAAYAQIDPCRISARNTLFRRPTGTFLLYAMGTAYPWGATPDTGISPTRHLGFVEYEFAGCTHDPDGRITDQRGRIEHDFTGSGLDVWTGTGLLPTGQVTLRETIYDPVLGALTIGGSNGQVSQKVVAGPYTKNGKLVYAFNVAGVLTYLSIPLDASTVTWTKSTTAP